MVTRIDDMSSGDGEILKAVARRGVTEVLHFTTSRGLLGALSCGQVLSRARLEEEEVVRLIAMQNCYRRWDTAWFDYVSMSIERINAQLYGISSGKWHADDEDLWWAVLSFDPRVLSHPAVVFATTNNGYSVTKRATGLQGFEALYAGEVTTWRGGGPSVINRHDRASAETTCPQAEVLYPELVNMSWLRAIFVPQPELADTVGGWFAATEFDPVPVVCAPEKFD